MTVTIKDNTAEQGFKLYKYDSDRQLSISGDTSNIEYANFYVNAFTEYKVNVDESDSSLINIPNQLLTGELSGEVLFTINSVDSVLFEGEIIILEREQPEDYTYTATTLKNSYNAEFDTDFIEGHSILYENNIAKINWDKFWITSLSYERIFASLSKLEEIDFRRMSITGDGKTPVTMEKLFYDCSSLKNIYWSKDISTENVTTLSQCFYGCKSLTSLDLSGWDTINVTTMSYMFKGCTSLTNLTLNDNWASNEKITTFDLSYCPIEHDYIVSVFNCLATRTDSPSLYISQTSYSNCTADEKKVLLDKGWRLFYRNSSGDLIEYTV